MAWRGSFSVYGEGIRCACRPWPFSCLTSIAFARWALVHGAIFGPRRDPVHGRKCAKGASLHRNCISMPEMAARGPVFRGVELRHEIDIASHQAKRIPCREPLAFS